MCSKGAKDNDHDKENWKKSLKNQLTQKNFRHSNFKKFAKKKKLSKKL
jgi:hypothetical protein